MVSTINLAYNAFENRKPWPRSDVPVLKNTDVLLCIREPLQYSLMLACWPNLCAMLLIYLSNSKKPTSKTRRLWMRVWSKDWWDNICPALLHRRWVEGEFLDWHDSHLMTLLIQQQQLFHVSYIITPFLRHCTCITLQCSVFWSIKCLHVLSNNYKPPLTIQIKFQSDLANLFWCLFWLGYQSNFCFLSNLLMNRNVAPFLGELPL